MRKDEIQKIIQEQKEPSAMMGPALRYAGNSIGKILHVPAPTLEQTKQIEQLFKRTHSTGSKESWKVKVISGAKQKALLYLQGVNQESVSRKQILEEIKVSNVNNALSILLGPGLGLVEVTEEGRQFVTDSESRDHASSPDYYRLTDKGKKFVAKYKNAGLKKWPVERDPATNEMVVKSPD